MMRRSSTWVVSALALVLTTTACVSKRAPVYEFEWESWKAPAAEESAPLGGEALSQMRYELERAHGDMAHYRATIESLEERRDKDAIHLFTAFLDAYIGLHLQPLLQSEWQSRHPELASLDANLRIAQAELLAHMHEPARMEEVMVEIRNRFAGRDNMLVEIGPNEQAALSDALVQLEQRRRES